MNMVCMVPSHYKDKCFKPHEANEYCVEHGCVPYEPAELKASDIHIIDRLKGTPISFVESTREITPKYLREFTKHYAIDIKENCNCYGIIKVNPATVKGDK